VQLCEVEQDKVYDKSVIIHPIYDHKHADTVYDEIIHDAKLCKTSAVFVLNGFTFSTKRSDVERRKQIFDRIKAVIELPPGMCKSSMVSTSIIIVDNEPSNIRLIDAQMMYTGEGRRRYLSIDDIESINNMMQTDTEKAHTLDKSAIDKEKCIILPSHYYNVTAGRPMMNISEAVVSVYGRRELLNLNEYDNGLVFSGRDIKVLTEDTDISKARLVVLLDSSKLLAEYTSLFFSTQAGQDLINSISYTATMPMWSKNMLELLSVPEMSIDDQKKTIAEAKSIKETIDDATNRLNSLFD
jgi:type I restriction-modification system DNA methylase subunit